MQRKYLMVFMVLYIDNGDLVTKFIKTTKNINQNTYIVASTGFESRIVTKEYFDQVITKPVNKETIEYTLWSYKGHRRK